MILCGPLRRALSAHPASPHPPARRSIPCDTGCASCSGPGQCFECASGALGALDPVNKKCPCKVANCERENASPRRMVALEHRTVEPSAIHRKTTRSLANVGQCLRSLICHAGAFCTSADKCDKWGCASGFYMDSKSNTCVACADPNCAFCQDAVNTCTGKVHNGWQVFSVTEVPLSTCMQGVCAWPPLRSAAAHPVVLGCKPGYGLVGSKCERCTLADQGCSTWCAAKLNG